MTPPFTLRTIVYALALVVLLAIILMGVSWCADRDRLKQAQAGKTLSDGRTAAAQDASAIRDRAEQRDAQINQTTQEATDAIRQAPDDRSAADAAIRGLCRLYPDRDPRCRVQQPGAGRVG